MGTPSGTAASSDPASPPRPSGLRHFLVSNLIVAAAQVLTKVRSLVMLPLLVHSLGTAGYGIWAQLLAFVGLVGAVVGWTLHHPLVQFIAADRKNAARINSTLTIATIVFAAAGALLVAPFAGPVTRLSLGDASLAGYLTSALMLVAINNLRLISLSVLRALGHFKAWGALELAGGLLELAGVATALKLQQGLGTVIAVMVGCNGVFSIAATLLVGRRVGWARPSRAILWDAVRFSAPMMPGILSLWILDRADRFIVGNHLGPVGVGVYSANYALGFLLLQALAPLQTTLLPRVAELWRTDRQLARRYIVTSNRVFMTLAIPYVAAMPVVAPILLGTLTNPEIAATSSITATLVAAGIALYGVSLMQGQAFYAERRTGILGIVWVACAAINLVLNLVLVPRFGVPGAALATTIAYFMTALGLGIGLRGILDFDYQPLHLLKACAAAGVMAAVLHLVAPASLATLLPWCAIVGALYFVLMAALRAFTADERDLALKILGKLGYKRG